MSKLLDIQPDDAAELKAVKEYARRELAYLQLKVEVLEARLRKRLLAKYGPASEKLTTQQLSLLELEPGVSQAEVEAEARRGPDGVPRRPQRERKARRHPGRQELPAELRRVEKVVALEAVACQCGQCGRGLEVIGYETSEQLELEPAQYYVLVTKREKRACRHCQGGGVRTAPAPARIIDKSLVSDRVIVETVVAKYCDHLPLYRQSAMLERETGVAIHRATLDGWVMQVGTLLGPLIAAMKRELVSGNYLQADETPVGVQVKDGRGKNHQGYLWQYSRPGGAAVFDFQMGRGREGPKELLRNFQGILQTDGYSAYDQVGGAQVVRAACWAHARRKFVEALQVNERDAAAARVVADMDAIFAVDAGARRSGLEPAARLALRQEKMRPLLEELQSELGRLAQEVLPASELGKAVHYTRSLWPRLVRVLEYADLELSNNLAENSMRGVALGRKNWIHVGSPAAGPRVAAIVSVVESCRRIKLPVKEYLLEILPGLGNRKVSEVAELTPTAWVRNRSPK